MQCLPEEVQDMRRQPGPGHRIGAQLSQGDFALPRQRMPAAHEECRFQRRQPVKLQVSQFRQAAAFAYKDIEAFRFERTPHGRRVRGLQVDAQLRVAPHQRLKHGIEQERCRKRPEASADRADFYFLQQLQVAPQLALFA
jgi:hypothetical protein